MTHDVNSKEVLLAGYEEVALDIEDKEDEDEDKDEDKDEL